MLLFETRALCALKAYAESQQPLDKWKIEHVGHSKGASERPGGGNLVPSPPPCPPCLKLTNVQIAGCERSVGVLERG